MSGQHSSIVEITRFQFQRFTVSIKELAEWFGLEVARIVVPASTTQLNGEVYFLVKARVGGE
jgi:hypothetical protein